MDMKSNVSGGTARKRVKGFTLVELIVVIAILAILAGTLNLAAQGYIRNAKRETANDNARLLFTGFQNIVTQCEIKQDNTVISPSFANDSSLKDVTITFKAYDGNVQVCGFKGASSSNVKLGTDYEGGMVKGYTDKTAGSNKSKLASAIANIIDSTFEGEAKVYIDIVNYEVKSVVYKPMSDSNRNNTINADSPFLDGDLNNFNTAGTTIYYYTYKNRDVQGKAYENHPLYGVYPFYDDIK